MSDTPGGGQPDEDAPPDHSGAAAAPPEQLSVLPVPVPGPSGVPDVDAALARLTEVADGEFGRNGEGLDESVEAYEQAHAHLQRALTGGVEAQADADR